MSRQSPSRKARRGAAVVAPGKGEETACWPLSPVQSVMVNVIRLRRGGTRLAMRYLWVRGGRGGGGGNREARARGTERCDSGNDERSPGAHDSSRGCLPRPATMSRPSSPAPATRIPYGIIVGVYPVNHSVGLFPNTKTNSASVSDCLMRYGGEKWLANCAGIRAENCTVARQP